MSANEHTATVFECIREGAEDYLLKPVTKKEVQNIWQHVWRRTQQLAARPLPAMVRTLSKTCPPCFKVLQLCQQGHVCAEVVHELWCCASWAEPAVCFRPRMGKCRPR